MPDVKGLVEVNRFIRKRLFYNVLVIHPMVFRPWDEWRQSQETNQVNKEQNEINQAEH